MDYSFVILFVIDVMSCYELEDKFEDFLKKFGGEMIGGGMMVDGLFCDFDFFMEVVGFEFMF